MGRGTICLVSLAAFASCQGATEPAVGLQLTLTFTGQTFDQFEVAVDALQSRRVRRAPAAAGSKLSSPQRVSVLLPSAWAGQEVALAVGGLFEGAVQRTLQRKVTLLADRLTPVELAFAQSCQDQCAEGKADCAEDGVRRCVVGSEGCRVWSAVEPCPTGKPYCSDGVCAATCVDECVRGTRRCIDGSRYQTCGNYDTDGCTDWSEPTSCGADEVCQGEGQCNVLCNGKPCSCTPAETKKCDDIGICRNGERRCEKGVFGVCQWQIGPQSETCNGDDDDCDGDTDEAADLQAPSCAKQLGVCKGARQSCGGKSGWQSCTASDYQQHAAAFGLLYEADETACDKVDNDCDGQVDEHPNCSACVPSCGSGKTCGKSDGCQGMCTGCYANASCIPYTSGSGGYCSCDVGGSCGTDNCCAAGQVCQDDAVCKTPPTVSWLLTAGGDGSEHVDGLVVDSAGDVIIAGRHQSDVTFGSTTITKSPGDVTESYLVKLAPDGSVRWVKRFSISGTTAGKSAGVTVSALAVDSQDNILVGGSYSDVNSKATIDFAGKTAIGDFSARAYVVKLDKDGKALWLRTSNKNGTTYHHAGVGQLVVDQNDDVFVGGGFGYSITFAGKSATAVSSYNSDVFVAKLSGSDGAAAWLAAGGGLIHDVASGLDLDSQGNVLIGGYYTDKATFGSITVGDGTKGLHAFVAKLSSAGVWQWAVPVLETTGGVVWPNDLTVTADDGAVAVGTFKLLGGQTAAKSGSFSLPGNASNALYAIKVDKAGKVLWAKSVDLGGSGAYRAGRAQNGDIWISGYFSSTTQFDAKKLRDEGSSAALAARLDAQSGDFVELVYTGTGSGSASAYGLAEAGSDALYIAGYYYKTAHFGTTVKTSINDSRDLFVAKVKR